VKEVIERTEKVDLPHDVQYIDIEYMIGYRILTVDQINYKGLGTYMKELRNNGIKLILIVDPGLVIEKNNTFYMTGVDNDIYIKWPTNLAPYDKDIVSQNSKDDAISWCWPNGKISMHLRLKLIFNYLNFQFLNIGYPDYLNNKTHKWWEQSLKDFMSNETYGCDMDGIWIDMV
jgi:alpha-glucosidase